MNMGKNFKQATKELLGGPKSPEEKLDDLPQDKKESTLVPESPSAAVLSVMGTLAKRGNTSPGFAQDSVIAEGDCLQGHLKCEGNIGIYGTVTGDVNSKGDVRLCGSQEGNVIGHNIEMFGGKIKGDVLANGSVKMDDASTVTGNVAAETLFLNGTIQGDLDIRTAVTLEKSAVVSGKISAGSLSVENGAVIQGEVTIRRPDAPKHSSGEKRSE